MSNQTDDEIKRQLGLDGPIQPGDLVRLKSLGPAMVARSLEGDEVLTEWFDKGSLKQHKFKICSLEKTTVEPLNFIERDSLDLET